MKRLSNLGIADLNLFDWEVYFSENAKRYLRIQFSAEDKLTEREKHLISPSIQMFQHGEMSRGHHLLKMAQIYAKSSKDVSYPGIMRLFVAEENRHSAYLRIFMEHYRIPQKKRNDLDSVFRTLRRAGGLEREVTVLVTAEIIALSYYNALSRCTGSWMLKKICRQMLHDELRHIVFQSNTLHKLGASPAKEILRALFLGAVSDVVWMRMHNIFRTGGYTHASFQRECFGYMRQSTNIALTGKIEGI